MSWFMTRYIYDTAKNFVNQSFCHASMFFLLPWQILCFSFWVESFGTCFLFWTLDRNFISFNQVWFFFFCFVVFFLLRSTAWHSLIGGLGTNMTFYFNCLQCWKGQNLSVYSIFKFSSGLYPCACSQLINK